MTDYAAHVLAVASSGILPPKAGVRFRADVARVQRHIARENATGIIRNLRIPTPRRHDPPTKGQS